jgi:predicted DCC family thiol-disulfide oxidoreductase YuxK
VAVTARYILFDAQCPSCTALADAIAHASAGRITPRSLDDPDTRAALDRARPRWTWEPMLMTVRRHRTSVSAGPALRLHLLALLGPRHARRIARLARGINTNPGRPAQAAPCGCADSGWRADPATSAAVETVKVSEAYRTAQRRLVAPDPADAWLDRQIGRHIVLYSMPADQPGTESFLAFVVDTSTRRVTEVRELHLRATAQGWQATNAEPALAIP